MARPVVGLCWRRSAVLCLLVAAIAQTASAQGVAGPFEPLQGPVRPGDDDDVPAEDVRAEHVPVLLPLSFEERVHVAQRGQRLADEGEAAFAGWKFLGIGHRCTIHPRDGGTEWASEA